MKSKKNEIKRANDSQQFARYFPSAHDGLSNDEVALRISQKLVNDTKVKSSKSYLSIFVKNTCTFFNLLCIAIAIALIVVKSYANLIFLVVISLNTILAIIQEIRAKITVEKLSIVTAPKVKVVRGGKEEEIDPSKLVLDDVIVLTNGDQVPADCVIIDGKVEVNESLLTGESKALGKCEGEPLLSGSFLVSGLCYARVEKVGKDNYVYQMAQRAREFKAPESNLFKDLNRFIKYITIALIPIGILTFIKELSRAGWVINANVVANTSGSLMGMIPAGMYLLITISLAVGVIKLAKKKTLVKDMYSIEMLARTNVLCLDKTGTITDGTMVVKDFVAYGEKRKGSHKKLLANVLANQKATNATLLALINEFGKGKKKAQNVLEFSSNRKYSVTEIDGKIYFLGAATRIGCALSEAQKVYIDEKTSQGFRVLAFSVLEGQFSDEISGKGSTLLALIALEDHIRKDASETIAWFKENGVEIKVISGDDPATVAKIAQRVGVEGSEKFISLENYSPEEVTQFASDYTVFGRVTPEQKYVLVKTLKSQGKVVAMTGDGVNDTLALKEADCSIAMADGSEVARNISKLVLLNSDFTALPAVVREGRQVINNVQGASSLFVMKTIAVMLLSVLLICLNIDYPFQSTRMVPVEFMVIGVPSFLLTFIPNTSQIKGQFISQVLKKSIPRSLTIFASVMTVILLNRYTTLFTPDEYATLLVLAMTLSGFVNLFFICFPFNWLKAGTCALSATLIVLGLLVMGKFFIQTTPVYSRIVWLVLLAIVGSVILTWLATYLTIFIVKKTKQKKKVKA